MKNRTDTHGNRPKPGQGRDFWIATWNVLSLFRSGALTQLTHELKRYKVTIAALQEIRWKNSDILKTKDYTIFYSGNNTNTLGTGFAVKKEAVSEVIGFKPKNERMCSIRIRGKMFNMTLINVHAPTEETDDKIKEPFYSALEKLYDEAPRHDIKIVIGDFNAKVGKETTFRPTIGKESLHEDSNNNGIRLIDFAIGKGMTVSSTRFPHKSIHKATWISPDGTTRNQIDHVLIDRRHGSDIQDVRSYRGADVDSDHLLVKVKYKQRINMMHNSHNKREQRYEYLKLTKDKQVADAYQKAVQTHLETTQEEMDSANTNINEQWDRIKYAMKRSAEEIIGFKQTNQRTEWFDEECKKSVEERNRARMAMLQRETRATRQLYNETRRKATKTCRKKKREWEKAKLVEIEVLARKRDIRGMYMKIKEQKNGFQARPQMCESKDGELITENSKVLERWAEYFEGILNANNEEDETYTLPIGGPDPLVNPPTLEETTKAIKSMRNHKAPGEDLITAELIKYGGSRLHTQIHDLISKIWEEEKMPTEWETALIIPLHKKGSKLECSNYRGISLLNITYKILTKLITKTLGQYTENILGDYQCGFRQNRSTTDHIFTIRCLLERCYEYNIPVHQLYVDYKMAYDSIRRNYLYETMQDFGIPNKLIRLVHMTLNSTKSKIKIQGETSREFQIRRGLRQGDSLSCILFNITLEKVIRNIHIDTRGTITRYFLRDSEGPQPIGTLYSQPLQYLAYADDIALLGKSDKDITKAFNELENASLLAGLEVNSQKTKYMTMSREERGKESSKNLEIRNYIFEKVNQFKYLGSVIHENNDLLIEIKERIAAGNKAYFSCNNMLKSKNINRNTKKIIYKTIIRPVIMYASETWTLTRTTENMLNTWERKILRRIYGPIQDEEGWRIRTNQELYDDYQDPTLVAEIKKGRLRWLGHLERMSTLRGAKVVYDKNPKGKRCKGRPRLRWLDDVETDLQQLGVKAWKKKAADRPQWKEVVKQAKALHGL